MLEKEEIMSTNKKIIITCVTAFIIVAALITLFFASFENGGGEDAGLRKNQPSPTPIVQSEQDREQEMEQREEIPVSFEEDVQGYAMKYLSTGDFTGLDTLYKSWLSTYKESFDQNADITLQIAMYRNDIAYFLSISDPDNVTLPTWSFNNPEVLAAAIAYAPISKKYDAIIDQSSVIYPGATSAIVLKESEKSVEVKRDALKSINTTRTEASSFLAIKIYDMIVFNRNVEFIAVMNKDTHQWEPYTMTLLDEHPDSSPPTVSLVTSIMESDPNTDIDSVIAVY